MFKRIPKLILGIVSLPVCAGVSISFYEQINCIKTVSYYSQKYFLLGIAAYLIIHATFFKPSYLYILSHEIMHAIATFICGGRVVSFRVSPKGGSIGTNKSNLFIALCPYFFPFYTIFVAAAFFITTFIIKDSPPYGIFLFLTGFTLTFHIILTIDFLKIRQTDLLHAGYLFSLCLIYTVNIIIIGFIFSLLFRDFIFAEFIRGAYIQSKETYEGIFRQLFL